MAQGGLLTALCWAGGARATLGATPVSNDEDREVSSGDYQDGGDTGRTKHRGSAVNTRQLVCGERDPGAHTESMCFGGS